MSANTADKGFYRTMLTIALPVALQNLISFSVNLMDTVMLGRLGEVALSAASLANQMFFIFNVVCFGVSSGAIVLCSQYWGKRDTVSIQKVTSLALKIVLVFAVLLTLIIVLIPAGIMSIFTPDAAVIEAGAKYLRMVSLSYIFSGISTIVLMILRSVGTVKVSVFIFSVSFFVNVFFNYMFIFGKFGAPELGVTGAAIGTVLARISECILLLLYLKFFENKVHFSLKIMIPLDRALLKDLLHYGLPVMVNELLWAVGISIHSVILGHISSSVVAANSICSVTYQMAMSFIFGIGSATAVMTGNFIGEGRIPYMLECVSRFKRVYLILGSVSAVLLILLKTPILSIYNIEPETIALANQFMYVYAFSIFFAAYTNPLITGILRGGGDTRIAAYIDIGCLWLVTGIGALLAAIFGSIPALVIFFILKLDNPMKTFLCLARLRNSDWIRNVTR